MIEVVTIQFDCMTICRFLDASMHSKVWKENKNQNNSDADTSN